MKRRDFIQRLGVTAAIVALPAVVIGKPRIYPWVEKDLQRRRSGQKPRFIHVHHCPQCKTDYLCPDRWEYDECGPTKVSKQFGWAVNKNHPCLPCNAQLDSANREAWREANRVSD